MRNGNGRVIRLAAMLLALALGSGAEADEKTRGSDHAPLGSPDFFPSADHPIGWRGDGSGRFPAATPPVDWFRRPRAGFTALKSLAAKPKGGAAEGQLLNMGMVREWLVAGPFEGKSHATALEDTVQPNEAALQPAVGQNLGGKPWTATSVSVARQTGGNGHLVLDLVLAYNKQDKQGAQNKPGTLEPLAAYAASYIHSPEPLQVRLLVQGQKVQAWLNATSVKIPGQYEPPPAVDLRAGWNLLVIKAASTKENWNATATFIPALASGYETKNIAWMAPMPGPSWSSPIVVGPRIFVGADAGTLVCVNKADGRTLWTRSTTFYHAVTEEERRSSRTSRPRSSSSTR